MSLYSLSRPVSPNFWPNLYAWEDGWTPLLHAAESRHEAIVKLLLKTGKVDTYLKDELGRTPLLWAARNHPGVDRL